MPDIMQEAQLFETSAKLQTASDAIESIARGEQIDHPISDVLRWSGEFLARLDLNEPRPDRGLNLAVQAATARPTYYASIRKVRQRFNDQDIRSESDLAEFLKALSRLLASGGIDSSNMSSARLRLAADFLGELSTGLISQLDHNGLPDQYPFDAAEMAVHVSTD